MGKQNGPRPASALESAVLAGLLPDLFDGELPPSAPGRRYEVTACLPGDDTPLMACDADTGSVAEVVAMVLGHCAPMAGFEVRIRTVG